ncbi:hypothetical protein QYE76_055825 [Lolium multiflorum]|uniref:Ribosomal protein L34e superfamily protein n=1 Tax=Lolium multiflorum TaxID=4521 RepID=A0AAD8T0F1_LOLMU|nr:hypothetical protein QYE76_055825 [Lolium multiflorum]
MAECRSLIEFLRAFEHHRRAADATYARSKRASSSPTSSSKHLTDLCENSSMSAAIDALLLLAVLAALGFLIIPHINHLILSLSALLHPATPYLSAAALAGAAATLAAAALCWALLRRHARRCGKPRCRGLRKAVEFDIQLETEECVRGRPSAAARSPAAALLAAAAAGTGARTVDLDDAHRELEVELRKMAPPNGRSVLVFRAPCGCPKGRMEVWGAKKVRRIKK